MTKPLVTILDDEPEIRTLLADALNEAGFEGDIIRYWFESFVVGKVHLSQWPYPLTE